MTRAPEASAASSGTPPPTRMASVLAKRAVSTPRTSGPSRGHGEQEGVPAPPRRVAAQREPRGAHRGDDGERARYGQDARRKSLERDQGAGEPRQRLSRLLEHLHDLRHDVHEQAGDDQDRDDASTSAG